MTGWGPWDMGLSLSGLTAPYCLSGRWHIGTGRSRWHRDFASGALDHPVTAVRHHNRAGDKARQIGGQKGRRPDDVIRLPGTAERSVFQKNPDQIGVCGTHFFVQWRFNKTRPDRIHAHAISAKLRSERPCEAQDAVL